MKLRVIITSQNGKSEIKEFKSAYCLIGRKNATLVLDDSRCSAKHLLLYEGPDGRLWSRDLGSTNGSFINGKRVVEKALSIGDSIRIGKSIITIAKFKPVKEGSITHGTLTVLGSKKSKEIKVYTNRSFKKQSSPEEDFVIPSTSYNNFFSEKNSTLAKSIHEKFIDYIDENGEKTHIRLTDLLKAA